jgi:Na+-driven multidrug efflux pump
MLPLGVSVGLAVKMGHVIGKSPSRAKLMAGGCMVFTAGLGVLVSLLLHLFRFQVIGAFTNDEDVLEMALAIWPELCYYLFLIYIFAINVATLRALGLQWRAASIIMVTLYCCTLPAVIYFAVVRGGGLIAQWKVLPVCYSFMQIALAMGYMFLNWNDHAKKIRHSLLKHHTSFHGEDTNGLPIPTEATPLVENDTLAEDNPRATNNNLNACIVGSF